MADENDDLVETLHAIEVGADIQIRDEAKREIDMRVMPWGVVINSIGGTEEFARGAFEGTDPAKVILIGPEHERQLALGHDGKPTLARRAVGKGIAFDERDDGAYMTFRVARTTHGDDLLGLVADGITNGVSVEFEPLPGGSTVTRLGGRRHVIQQRARMDAVTTTYRPAYGEQAAVLAVRSQLEGEPEVTEASAAAPEATAPVPAPATADEIAAAVTTRIEARAQPAPDPRIDELLERFDSMEERARASFQIPSGQEPAHPDDFTRGDWLKTVLKTLSGETVNQADLHARVAAELITADNLGVVPPAYLAEIIGIIDPARPFLQSTRRLTTPRSGMQFTVPKIVTRPTTAVQVAEKDELASTTTSIVPANFNPVTIGGYGDISIQLLKRSDPSYLEMYLDLLAEAYATDADDEAVNALLAEADVNEGGAIAPDDGPLFGSAWANGTAVSRRLTPDTIWLSTAAVGAFIDAKSTTTNAPLYSNLAGNFTAAGGPGGTISGLRPVHVPALDDEAVDLIVGPSRGFAWAEDGTYTLQVDVPAKAGRDVGIVGMLWFAPLYPAAFTSYTITS